nr:hypothetical protein asmbl_16 [uncultured bacterium]
MDRVLAVLRAVLLQLDPVGVVPPVLAGDVVAVLALLARQGDLRTDVSGCHERFLALFWTTVRDSRVRPCPTGAGHDDGPRSRGPSWVAVTGLEPVTQRL